MPLIRSRSRQLLFASFAIVMIAIACGGGDDEVTAPVVTVGPAPTSTPAPTAAPEPTSTTVPVDSAEPSPTATTAPAVAVAPTPTVPDGVQSVTVTASKDNTLYESTSGELSNGAGMALFVGKTGRGEARRALIQFDLTDSIPSGATIVTATIELQLDRTSSGESNGTVHRVTADWGEGESDAPAEEGGGAPAASGDATWVHRFFDAETWKSQGGDFIAEPSAEAILGGFGAASFGTTEGLVSDVQRWADDASSNFGWIIIGDESHGQTAKRFVSAQGEDPGQRPRLVIGFSAGEPQAAPEPTAIPPTQTPATVSPVATTPTPTPAPAPTATPAPEPTATPVAQSFSITAFKDNTLYESGAGTLSNGSGTSLFAGKTNNGSTRRALIAFDVAGSIPAGSRITRATLDLMMTRTIAGDTAVSLHRVQTDWGEGTSDAPGNEGAGTDSTDGDATWLHSQFDSKLWTNSGGDFSPQSSAETTVGGAGAYTWESTDQMVIDVQRWLDDPSENFGWILLGDETRGATAKRFASTQTNDTAKRPILRLEFTRGG
ncbi:MAG: DNRLRE domain-containing protein [Chloroflexi bacterium]|nr:DNRLRE domain-containing protein [Chloroflexota bacterium]